MQLGVTQELDSFLSLVQYLALRLEMQFWEQWKIKREVLFLTCIFNIFHSQMLTMVQVVSQNEQSVSQVSRRHHISDG